MSQGTVAESRRVSAAYSTYSDREEVVGLHVAFGSPLNQVGIFDRPKYQALAPGVYTHGIRKKSDAGTFSLPRRPDGGRRQRPAMAGEVTPVCPASDPYCPPDIGSDLPCELVSVTCTVPSAVGSPEYPKGIVSVNPPPLAAP